MLDPEVLDGCAEDDGRAGRQRGDDPPTTDEAARGLERDDDDDLIA